jgi:pSer/pThr/pTyr-binding forkhead associated (FHA) protein
MPTRDAVGSYVVPEWSTAPTASFGLEVIKDGSVIETIPLNLECTLFGRNAQVVDVRVQHASTSREHAVIQFGKDNTIFIADHMGSTHGTFVNKQRLKAKDLVKLQVGDMIRFGESTRLYHLVGPAGMEPAEEKVEQNLENIRLSKLERKKMEDERSNEQDSSGISWGMSMTDADDEDDENDETNNNPEDDDEVPEYVRRAREKEATQGAGRFATSLDSSTLSAAEANAKDAPLLERLEKQRAKALNIQLEVERIQAKEINQGDGLTEGQVRMYVCVCMYVCVYVCVYVCNIWIYVYVIIYGYVDVYMWIWMCTGSVRLTCDH